MGLQRFITKFIALSVAILMLVATAPISAAEIAAPANIGSVSAVGSVQLRGIGISEGTLFSGDRLNVAPGGYAKVVLGAGPKIEVGGSSDVTLSRDTNAVNIQMTSGNIAFSGNGQKPVRVRIGVYEVTAAGQSKGSVAFVGTGAFGVRVLDGTVSVRNTSTKQSFTVGKGTERLISLGDANQSGALLASTSPTAIPPVPAMPARQGLSGGAKKALLVGAVLGSAAAIGVLMYKNDDSSSSAAARLRLTKAASTQTLSSIGTATVLSATASAGVETAAAAASSAINNAPLSTSFTQADKTALVGRANTLSSAAGASKAQIAKLQGDLGALQTQLADATPETMGSINDKITELLNNVNAEVAVLNGLIGQLNQLVTDARLEVANVVPVPTIQPVPPAIQASQSNP